MKHLTEKFISGLKKYNLSLEDIQKSNWKYCGGNKGRHLNYYKMMFKDKSLPKHEDKCVCGHDIKENCYITDGEQTLVLGNCCIKKFIIKNKRTCEICDKPHKNRKVNRCNECRVGICDDCNKPCNEKYKRCYSCTFG